VTVQTVKQLLSQSKTNFQTVVARLDSLFKDSTAIHNKHFVTKTSLAHINRQLKDREESLLKLNKSIAVRESRLSKINSEISLMQQKSKLLEKSSVEQQVRLDALQKEHDSLLGGWSSARQAAREELDSLTTLITEKQQALGQVNKDLNERGQEFELQEMKRREGCDKAEEELRLRLDQKKCEAEKRLEQNIEAKKADHDRIVQETDERIKQKLLEIETLCRTVQDKSGELKTLGEQISEKKIEITGVEATLELRRASLEHLLEEERDCRRRITGLNTEREDIQRRLTFERRSVTTSAPTINPSETLYPPSQTPLPQEPPTPASGILTSPRRDFVSSSPTPAAPTPPARPFPIPPYGDRPTPQIRDLVPPPSTTPATSFYPQSTRIPLPLSRIRGTIPAANTTEPISPRTTRARQPFQPLPGIVNGPTKRRRIGSPNKDPIQITSGRKTVEIEQIPPRVTNISLGAIVSSPGTCIVSLNL
jgi:uncharacterized protein YukE